MIPIWSFPLIIFEFWDKKNQNPFVWKKIKFGRENVVHSGCTGLCVTVQLYSLPAWLAVTVQFRPGQTFETQYFNTNYFTFRSLFGHIFGLRNLLGDIKVLDRYIFEKQQLSTIYTTMQILLLGSPDRQACLSSPGT